MEENKLPELDKNEVDEVVELFKNVYQPAVRIVSAYIRKHPTNSSKIITSEWSQRNLERGTPCKILRTLLSDNSLKTCVNINTVDVSHWTLNVLSQSEKFRAVIHTASSENGDKKKKYYLEIWSEEKLLMTLDLAALDIHGIVYTDEMFGSLNWSHQEDKIVYVAEKKRPKTAPFYEQKLKIDTIDEKNKPLVGEQHIYEDDWGEQMSPKTQPEIVVCDISTKNIEILDGVPKSISPGQIIWEPTGNGVVGIGVYHKPRRLGIIFCTNRPSIIFHLTLDGKFNKLSDEKMSVLCPRFSPDGKYLIWLQRPVGGPHHSAWALVKCDWNTKQVTTIIDIVDKVILTKNGKEFYGIYSIGFPLRFWTSDSKFIIFSTPQIYRINSYAVNIDDKSIWDIGSSNEDESTTILDISEDDFAVCSKTSLTQPSVLASIHVPSVIAITSGDHHWYPLTKPVSTVDTNMISRFKVFDLTTTEERCYAMYYGPKSERSQSVPLLLYPHGGPHSSVPSAFSPLLYFFTQLGFGVLIVNYRGSTGCGKDFLDSLLGNVGSLDTQDCYVALQNSFKKFSWLNPKQVVLFGGSHGGFIVTHLSSQYPNDFKAIVALNPVINLPAMLYTTDIPDWTVVESGSNYDGTVGIMHDLELWKKMGDISPINNVKNVRAPTLLLLGKKDLRVPPFQGLSYFNALKEMNVPTKVFFYDDNHSLSSIPVEMDAIINAALWCKRCMKRL